MMKKKYTQVGLLAFIFLSLVTPLLGQVQLPSRKAPIVLASNQTISCAWRDTLISIDLMANISYQIDKDADWLNVINKENSNTLHIKVAENFNSKERMGSLFLQSEDKLYKEIITITQGKINFEDFVRRDRQVKVSSGTASSFQSGSNLDKSFDGDLSTMYHSNWSNGGSNYFPITLTYQFKNVDSINYLVYNPRQTGGNGHFKEVEIQYTTAENPNFTKFGDFDFKGDNASKRIEFPNALVHPTAIRFIVKSGAGDGQGFAACAEMQFFQKTQQDEDFTIFKDDLWTELREDVTEEEINACNNMLARYLGLGILNGTYAKDFRVNSFEPVYDPNKLGQILHIGNGYSRFQHVTGIVMKPGVNVILVDGLKEGSSVGLRVAKLYAPEQEEANDWGLHTEYIPLTEGVNVVTKSNSWTGLAYVDYYFDNPENENTIKIHFVNGVVNGYFDSSKDTNEDWDRLLNNAVYPVFDAVGRYSQLAYPVEDLRRYAPSKGLELVGVYDTLVYKQQEIIGLKKYNRIPKNKIFARVNYGYYMFRDGNGVAFKYDTMSRVASPDNMKEGDEDACWGFSHEVGHVHQLEPYLSWGGLGETSNNICSRYCTQALGYNNRLANAFTSSIKNLMDNASAGKQSASRAEGGMSDTKIYSIKENPDLAMSYLEVDVFERLVPFWRLQCYFVNNGYKDFYPDLYERMRTTEERYPEMATLSRHENVVPYQFNFIKEACLLTKMNLYPYFEAYGFFRLLTLTYGDYGTFTYRMTAEMRDTFKAELDALVQEGVIREMTDEELHAMIHAEE